MRMEYFPVPVDVFHRRARETLDMISNQNLANRAPLPPNAMATIRAPASRKWNYARRGYSANIGLS